MVILLLCMYFCTKERLDRKSIILVVLLNLFFPFTITYNKTYYTAGFKGILFIVLVTVSYYLFFKNLKENKFNILYIILLGTLSLMVRLRSVFLILVLFILTIISINWIRNKKIRELLWSFPIFAVFVSILFILFPISIKYYFLFDKFKPVNIRSLVNNLFLFPRENSLILVLSIWLLFVNLIYLLSEKNKSKRKELLFILAPEILICIVYLLLFTDNDITGFVLHLGLFPFIPLNIFYFYNYINGSTTRNRNIVFVIFTIISIIGLVLDTLNRFIPLYILD